MTMQCADGSITLTTGVIGTTFTVSGLPFQPKAIFFFHSGASASGQAEGDHRFGAGFAVSTTSRRSYTTQSDHGAATMANDNVWHNDCCVSALSVAGASAGKADLDAITSDGFRLIIDEVFVTSMITGWMAYGGDITDTAIVDFIEPAAVGNQDYSTGFALDTGLDDKAIIFLGVGVGAAGVVDTYSNFVFGIAAGNTPANYTLSGCSVDAAATSITNNYCRSGECVAQAVNDIVTVRGGVTAWLSNGFRINWAEIDGAGFRFSALVVKGGRWQAGDALTSTGTSNQTEATTYIPKGLLIASHGKAQSTSDVAEAHDERTIGAATSATSRRCAAILDKDAAATADIGVAFSEVAMYVNQSTDVTIVQEGAMDLVSLDSTPGFTFVMDDADPAQAFFWYLLAADAGRLIDANITQAGDTLIATLVGPNYFNSSKTQANDTTSAQFYADAPLWREGGNLIANWGAPADSTNNWNSATTINTPHVAGIADDKDWLAEPPKNTVWN